MIWLLVVASVFRDVRPDQPGFQASWLYVLICLICPAVLGVLMATLTGAIGRLLGRKTGRGGSGV
jgi:hypothetical protein